MRGDIILTLILASGSLYGWSVVLYRFLRRLPILPWQPRAAVSWGLIDVLGTLGMMVLLQGVGLLVLGVLLGVENTDPTELPPHQQFWFTLVGSLATLLSVALSMLVIWRRNSGSWREFGFAFAQLIPDLRLGLVVFVLFAAPVYGIQYALVYWGEMPSRHPIIEYLVENPNPLAIALSVFAAVLVAPVCEEYLFRMLFQGWMEGALFEAPAGDHVAEKVLLGRWSLTGNHNHKDSQPAAPPADEFSGRTNTGSDGPDATDASFDTGIANGFYTCQVVDPSNPYSSPLAGGAAAVAGPQSPQSIAQTGRWGWVPILVSASIFALMHLSHGPDWVALFVFSLGLGVVYQRTHRLLPVIVVHLLLNACSLFSLFLASP